jgi:uncharacterized protein (DUF2336 family)
MTTTRSALTEADIRLLAKGAEPEERALAAERICRHIDRADLTDQERIEAREILRLVACDAAEQVRRALALTLKASPLVPRDVALRLARDVESIAVPVLNFSRRGSGRYRPPRGTGQAGGRGEKAEAVAKGDDHDRRDGGA